MNLDLREKYFYPQGSQWADSMEAWARGGVAVSFNAFPWKDWLTLSLSERMNLFLQREWFIQQFGYALPNAEFIQACLKHGPFLELGAGSGFLASLLARQGVDIVATDIGKEEYAFRPGQCFPIQQYTANEALKIFPHRTVLLAWPCYQDKWAKEALKEMKSGQTLIYIGESKNGCNATHGFFDFLKSDFSKIESLPWKPFPYLQDSATVYRKK